MSVQTKALLALLAVTISSTLRAWNERDNRLRAEGRAQIEAQRGDSLADLVEEYAVIVDSATVRMERVREESDSVVSEAEAKVDSIRRHRPAPDTIVTRLVNADCNRDSVTAAIGSMVASYEAEISELQRITAQQLAMIDGQDDLIQALQTEAQVKDQLIGSLRAQIEAMGQTRPGWVERNTSRGLLVGVGMVAGFLTAEAIR